MRNTIRAIIKKYWLLLLLLIVGIPVLINCLFKIHPTISFFSAEWNAGDALGFYGTLLASLIAIAGVYLSINYAQENYRKDERNRQLPYLALTYMQKDSRFNLFDSAFTQASENRDDVESYYAEYRLDRVYIVITKDGIEYRKKLDGKQNSILQQGGLTWDTEEKAKVLRPHNYISLPFEIENVGNGAAIDFKLAFNKNDCPNRRAVSLYTLKCGSKVYFHIFSDLESESILGDYNLDLEYSDILCNHYSQKYPISFQKEGNQIKQTMDFSGKQDLVQHEQSAVRK